MTARDTIFTVAQTNGWGADVQYAARIKDPMYAAFRKDGATVEVWFTKVGGVLRAALFNGTGVIVVPTRLKAQAVKDELAGK